MNPNRFGFHCLPSFKPKVGWFKLDLKGGLKEGKFEGWFKSEDEPTQVWIKLVLPF